MPILRIIAIFPIGFQFLNWFSFAKSALISLKTTLRILHLTNTQPIKFQVVTSPGSVKQYDEFLQQCEFNRN